MDDCGGAMEATIRIRADEFSTSCRNFTLACIVRHMSENRLSGARREKLLAKILKLPTNAIENWFISWAGADSNICIGWLPKVWASIFSFCSFRCVSMKNDVDADEYTYAYAPMRMLQYCNEIIYFVFLFRSHHARTRHECIVNSHWSDETTEK